MTTEKEKLNEEIVQKELLKLVKGKKGACVSTDALMTLARQQGSIKTLERAIEGINASCVIPKGYKKLIIHYLSQLKKEVQFSKEGEGKV